METKETIIWDAEFNDAVTTYWLLNGTIVCVITIIGIPFLIVWIIVGKWITRKYLASHKCTLTDKTLKVSKGILTKTEKTIPLDRITDMGLVQGPVMRYFDIESLSVETAGQSTMGSNVSLSGVKNGRAFRDAVLRQRDIAVAGIETNTPPQAEAVGSNEVVDLLKEIRDSLRSIEGK